MVPCWPTLFENEGSMSPKKVPAWMRSPGRLLNISLIVSWVLGSYSFPEMMAWHAGLSAEAFGIKNQFPLTVLVRYSMLQCPAVTLGVGSLQFLA